MILSRRKVMLLSDQTYVYRIAYDVIIEVFLFNTIQDMNSILSPEVVNLSLLK